MAKKTAKKGKNLLDFRDTSEIQVSKKIIDQVIGQEDAVEIIKKSASQRRHVLLIGDPGTGKSMLGQGLAELLPGKSELDDVLVYPNEKDPQKPVIRTFPAGRGEEAITGIRTALESNVATRRILLILIGGGILVFGISMLWRLFKDSQYAPLALVTGVGNLIWLVVIVGFLAASAPRFGKMLKGLAMIPKPLVTHKSSGKAPFVDATGAHSGALLGDVLHDPFQSGGFETPAHERVEAGMIHRANKGVLFIDEIANLKPESQQALLTALQEKKFAITGQSERSSGSLVHTEAVPCDFVLVAAGNVETVQHMHPALRSRIRGYGHEVYMKNTMPDTPENRRKIAVFVAQEVIKDKKIPHFSKSAVERIIMEARKRANRKYHITLRLRELGGLIRAAGDIAVEEKAKLVEPSHIDKAMKVARTLEQQMADKYIEMKKEYEVIRVTGKQVGRVNGLAVIGSEGAFSGIILPIEAEVTPGGKESQIIATGKLGNIAKEAVKNVSAIIKKYFGLDIKGKYDIYVQFLQTHEGVEGDSASIAVATAIISALKHIPVKQDYAMTGSLSVRGEVLPVGGVSSKVEAAIEAGTKYVIVPKANLKDIVLEESKIKKIRIIPVERISEVLKNALDWKGKQDVLKKIMAVNGF